MSADKELLREIDALIAENARLLGEEVQVRCVRQASGWVRIYGLDKSRRVVRSEYVEYRTLRRAHRAAVEANRRAQIVAEKVKAGMTVAEAIRATPIDESWRAA